MRDLVDQVPWRSAIAAALATAARITKETKSAIMATTWPLKAESFEGENRPRGKKPLWFGFQAPAGMRQAAVFDSPSVFRPFSPLHAHHAHHGRCPPDCQKRPPQTNARGAPPGPLRVCRQSMSAVSPSANYGRADTPQLDSPRTSCSRSRNTRMPGGSACTCPCPRGNCLPRPSSTMP